MAFPSHRTPPSADRIDRKAGGVMIGAHADPSDIVGDVIDAVWNGAAQFGIDKIMNSDLSRNVPNLGPRVTIVDNTGKRISRLGGLGPGLGPTEFLAPHGLTVDSHGDLYVGEVSWTNWPQTFRDKPRPDSLRSLHKFRKVG